MKINTQKLCEELKVAGITTHGNCNSNGVVWDDDNKEIQDRPDVKAIVNKHTPETTPEPTVQDQIKELKKQVDELGKKIK